MLDDWLYIYFDLILVIFSAIMILYGQNQVKNPNYSENVENSRFSQSEKFFDFGQNQEGKCKKTKKKRQKNTGDTAINSQTVGQEQ